MSVTVWGLYSADVAPPSAHVLRFTVGDGRSSSTRTDFLYKFAKTEQTWLRKTVVVLHIHSHISIKIKLKIITSLLLCYQASCQRLTLHHLDWRDGPQAKATLWAGGRELLVSFSGERRKFSVFPERRKQIVKPGAAMLLK